MSHREILKWLKSHKYLSLGCGLLVVLLALGFLAVNFNQGSIFDWGPDGPTMETCSGTVNGNLYRAECNDLGNLESADDRTVFNAPDDIDGGPMGVQANSWYKDWYADYLIDGLDIEPSKFDTGHCGWDTRGFDICTNDEQVADKIKENLDTYRDITGYIDDDPNYNYEYAWEFRPRTNGIPDPIDQVIRNGQCSITATLEDYDDNRVRKTFEGDLRPGGTGLQCVLPTLSDSDAPEIGQPRLFRHDVKAVFEIETDFTVEKWTFDQGNCQLEEFVIGEVPEGVYDSREECRQDNQGWRIDSIEGPENVTVGEEVKYSVDVGDSESYSFTITWSNGETGESADYEFDSTGNRTVSVTVDDGFNKDTEEIRVRVEEKTLLDVISEFFDGIWQALTSWG